MDSDASMMSDEGSMVSSVEGGETMVGEDATKVLPEALLRRVFSFLSLSEVTICAQVCRRWNIFIENDDRWSNLCHAQGMVSRPFEGMPWRRVFILSQRTAKNWTRLEAKYSTRTLKKGHKNDVWCMEQAGDVLVTGSSDRTVKVWDTQSLRPRLHLRGHEGAVWAIDYDPVTGIIASGDTEGVVRLWDGETGELRTEMQTHHTTVSALQLEGDQLITGSFDNSICVTNLHTGARQTLQGARHGGHKFHIWCLRYVHGRLVSGGWDCKLKLWDLAQGGCVMNMVGHTGPVRCVDFDGSRVVSGAWDKTVKMWDLAMAGSTCIHTLEGHRGAVAGLAVDGAKIVSGGYDGEVRIWDVDGAPPQCVTTAKANKGGVLCLRFDWRRVYTGGKDNKVKVLDFASRLLS